MTLVLLFTIASLYTAVRKKREREERRMDTRLRMMDRIMDADAIAWGRRNARA